MRLPKSLYHPLPLRECGGSQSSTPQHHGQNAHSRVFQGPSLPTALWVTPPNSPRLPAEKRLEQADPDRASFPSPTKFSDATPPPPTPPRPVAPVPIPWRSCKPMPCRILAPARRVPPHPPPHPLPPPPPTPPHPLCPSTLCPPFLSWGGRGCRGGARKRLQFRVVAARTVGK